jgi:DNA repair protein RadC
VFQKINLHKFRLLPGSLARNYGTNTAPAHSPIIFSVPPCAKPGQKPGSCSNQFFHLLNEGTMEQHTNQLKLNLVEEVTLIYRTRIKPSERPKVTNSQTTYELLLSHWDPDTIELQEEFKVLYLNRSGRVIGLYEVSKGGLTGTVVDPRLIFSAALKMMACSIIVAHNHPSGTTTPSAADVEMTKKIKDAGCLLEIAVLDHLIITRDGYLSFADEGLL